MSETTAPAKTAPTEYVVLELHMADVKGFETAGKLLAEAELWRVIGKTTVNGSEKKIIDSVTGGNGGTFKAVAARSWKGGETKVQQTVMASLPYEEEL